MLVIPFFAAAQSLHLHDSIKTFASLTNTTVILSGRSELRLTQAGDPLPGCVVHLDSPDSSLLLSAVAPSQVASALLGRLRVNGSSATLNGNLRVVQYAEGAIVLPHSPDLRPLEVFAHRYYTGRSRRLEQFRLYDSALLGAWAGTIGSFKLKRGYMATFAEAEAGAGRSRCYVAQDGDLEVGRLPSVLETNIHFVRVFPWRWTGKKGIAGNIESGLNLSWLYNWNLDRNSTPDWEYVPIRQNRWWPGLDHDWNARGSTHLLGYNEPDRPDQANLTVTEAISSWPDLLRPGLRVGAPAVSDGGLSWLYSFMSQADGAGLRVDFVPVHYYRCYGNPADPVGAANQFYNFLKGIYDVVQRPLWISEWNNGANWTSCADPTIAQQQAAIAAMIDMLESTPFVERYALYNWVEDVRRVKWDDGSLTAAGVTYRDKLSALAYRQEMADAGVGSSARYAFDGDGHDGWGNGQDAMLVGAPKFTAGKFEQAIELNGTTDYLQVSPRLGDSTDFSFAGWVFWNGGAAWQRIFDLGSDTAHYLFLSPRSSGGLLRFAINNGAGEQQLSAPPLPVATWTHVAVTISGSTGKLFVNGASVATNTSMSINTGDVGTKFNYLGRSRFSADPLFSGRFDDFRFVSSALTDAQVAAISTTPPPRFLAATLYLPNATIGQPYSTSMAGEATGSGPLTFTKMDGPAWLAVAVDGALTGTPGATDAGLNNFLVRVTDTNGSLHTATLLILVPTVIGTLSVMAESSEDDAEQAASGEVTLTSTDLELVNDDATGAGDQLVGLRFNDISIPPGAIVTNATIQFTADESQTETTALSIFLQAADHAAPFLLAANNLGARPRLALSVPWTPGAWTAGQSSTNQLTPNLAGLVQEILSRPGWAAGNSIAFLISGTGHRTADAADKSGGSPARLLLEYVVPPQTRDIVASITASANDAEESPTGAVTLDSTDLELVNDAALGDQTVGLRFENLRVPPGAIVNSTDIQFTADEIQTGTTSLMIRAQAADDASVFTATANDLTARPLTSASVPWKPASWNTIGERGPLQRTPDLTKVVQEVINRPRWAAGNALAFVITGTGHRTADSFEKPGGTPATLKLIYQTELPLGSYIRWAAAHSNASFPSADSDADRFSNLMEYAIGLDPTMPDRSPFSLIHGSGTLAFTYTRPTHVIDLVYSVEWADTLTSAWTTTGVTQQIIHDDGARRTIRAILPRGASPQRFIRLKVTQSTTGQ